MLRKTAAILLVLTVAALFPSVEAESTSYNNDCSGNTNATFSWSDTVHVDYKNLFEQQSPPLGGPSPQSSVNVQVTIKCKVDGFNLGDVFQACGTSDPSDGNPPNCIKFWHFFYVPVSVYGADPSPPAQITCNNAIVTRAGGGFASLAPYTTSAATFAEEIGSGYMRAMCEYACIRNSGPCTMGADLTVSTSSSVSFEWETNDNALPGGTTSATFKAGSRHWFNPSTQQTVTGIQNSRSQTICQGFHSLIASTVC